MKKAAISIFIFFVLLLVFPCFADVDPILLDEPNENVFGCKNDIFIELMEKPVIGKSTSGRNAVDNYLYFKTEILFLASDTWDGIDKNSFWVKHTSEDETEEYFPLDFAITTLTNLKNGWNTLSEPLDFTYLSTINLVFDVIPTDRNGWTFVFRPTERGSNSTYCEIEIPLTIR